MHSTYRKGQIAEAKVQLRAYEKDHIVSRPTCEARYDLIIDIDNKLYRVQVKYADRLSKDKCAVELDLRKETRNNGSKRVYTSDEVDAVVVYVPSVDKIMWLPPSLFDGKRSLSFRIKPLVRKYKGSRFVSDFEW